MQPTPGLRDELWRGRRLPLQRRFEVGFEQKTTKVTKFYLSDLSLRFLGFLLLGPSVITEYLRNPCHPRLKFLIRVRLLGNPSEFVSIRGLAEVGS